MRPFHPCTLFKREVSSASKGSVHVIHNCFPKSISRGLGGHTRRRASNLVKMEERVDYASWSQASLIERVTQLEKELKDKNSRSEGHSNVV